MNVTETPPWPSQLEQRLHMEPTFYAGDNRWRKSFSYSFPVPNGGIRSMTLVGRDYQNKYARVKLTRRDLAEPTRSTGCYDWERSLGMPK